MDRDLQREARLLLEGAKIRLIPLGIEHCADLLEAALEDRSSYAVAHVPSTPAEMRVYVEHAIARREAGTALPFATVDRANGRIVGTTRFNAMEQYAWREGSPNRRPVDAVEIGWTWLAQSAQQTGANIEAKYLMLAYAFGTWRCHRVYLKTDARNSRSRRAIEGIGATFEGVLRGIAAGADGALRDSAFYSITEGEWPRVRDHLETRLNR